MLRKFIFIRNVGKFKAHSAQGDDELRPLTLIYADNGLGKTTLGAVLRSLHTGNPAYILGRKTLGQSDSPSIQLRFDSTNVTFAGDSWTAASPSSILIFDPDFIDENVYTGCYVQHSHKRNLYNVIIGTEAVSLAVTVGDLDAQSRKLAGIINQTKSAIQVRIQDGLSFDDFLALPQVPDIDAQLADSQSRLNSLTRAAEVSSRPTLSEIRLPTFLMDCPPCSRLRWKTFRRMQSRQWPCTSPNIWITTRSTGWSADLDTPKTKSVPSVLSRSEGSPLSGLTGPTSPKNTTNSDGASLLP